MPTVMPLESAKALGGPVRGQTHPSSKLTDADVRAVRRLFRTGQATKTELARMFGVSTMAIHFVVTRQTWAHLPEDES